MSSCPTLLPKIAEVVKEQAQKSTLRKSLPELDEKIARELRLKTVKN